jgi:type II secretory pathway component GspD/PulD (secretin)
MGGYTSVGNLMNDVWRSTDKGVTWMQQTAAASWSERYGHSSVALPDGSIVLMGGGSSGGSLMNDVWRSTDNGVTWTQQTTATSWSERKFHISVALPDGSIVLMGGYSLFNSRTNDVWRSSNNGVTWTQQTAAASWVGRDSHTAVTLPDGSIVLMGGFDGESAMLNDVWRSTDNGVTWTQQIPSAPWSGRENRAYGG